MIRDRNIEWLTKRLYIPWKSFSCIGRTQGSGSFFFQDIEASAEAVAIATSFTGVTLATTEDLNHTMPLPYDIDPEEEVGFTVNWCTSDTTITHTVVWTVLFDTKAENIAFAVASTALNTIITSDVPNATGDVNQWTSRGIKNAGFLTRDQVAGGRYAAVIKVYPTTSDVTGIRFLGLEIDYKVRATED